MRRNPTVFFFFFKYESCGHYAQALIEKIRKGTILWEYGDGIPEEGMVFRKNGAKWVHDKNNDSSE